MAQVLAAMPMHGLEAVLAAIEPVLALGTITGERVLNVLPRLHQPIQHDAQIDSMLPSAPPADTGRYDRQLEMHDVA